jgi:hypothetical protein
MIPTWSFSRLQDFEKCRYMAYLKYVEKSPEPPKVPPEGKTEHPLDRGNRVHLAAETFVKENIELIPELRHFEEDLLALKKLYADNRVSIEEEWALDKSWTPTAWSGPDTWLRLKLDAFVQPDERTGVVIDHKTGKKFGNEVKHAEQGQLYQLVAFLKHPDLTQITVEFWYLDINDISKVTYSRETGMRLLERFDQRGRAFTECTDFKPNPNIFSCKYCPFGKRGTGVCPSAV